MTCNFMSFSTVFQSHQDNGRVIKERLCAMDDGRMYCNVTSYSTVFHSYQDNIRVITEGCVQCNLVNGWKDFCLKGGSNLGLPDQSTSA